MCYWKPDIWCNWCSWTWRSLERSRGYEFEIRICSNKRQWLVHDFRTFRNSSERIKNEHLRTRNVPNGWERTSRGIKIIEVLNGLKPRSLFKGAASGYELILEMFILNIKKVHHQIRNHIRYLNRIKWNKAEIYEKIIQAKQLIFWKILDGKFFIASDQKFQ